jgi:hypothetical protein
VYLFTFRGPTHVLLGRRENEREVLRAIVRASFEVAPRAKPECFLYNPYQSMSDRDADQYIDLPPRKGYEWVIYMDQVDGRDCSTFVRRRWRGHYIVDDDSFFKHRGSLEPMLKRVQQILADKTMT